MNKKQSKPKIYTANGSHVAVCEVNAVILPPTSDEGSYRIRLEDDTILLLEFKYKKLREFLKKQDISKPLKLIAYPSFKERKLFKLTLVAWESKLLEHEKWVFRGCWDLNKFLVVQRNVTKQVYTKHGNKVKNRFINTPKYPKIKCYFKNTNELIEQKKLWINYGYHLNCYRENNELIIAKAIPLACPYPRPINQKKRKKNNEITNTRHRNNRPQRSVLSRIGGNSVRY